MCHHDSNHYLQVVNGPDHAGAVGPPPSRLVPDAPGVPDTAPPAGWRDVLTAKGPAGFAKVRPDLRPAAGRILPSVLWPCSHV